MNQRQRTILVVLSLTGLVVWGLGAVFITVFQIESKSMRVVNAAEQPISQAARDDSPNTTSPEENRPLAIQTVILQTPPAGPTAPPTVTPVLPTETLAPPTPTPSPTVSPTATLFPDVTVTVTPVILTRLYDTLSLATATALPTATPQPVSAADLAQATDRYILVDQNNQVMEVYEKGALVKSIPTSTGKPVSNMFTPAWAGVVGAYWGKSGFIGGDLVADYIWYLFPGPEGSILIHSVPYLLETGEKAYDKLEALGVDPVSNGCVRISPEDAAWLLNWNPVGVPIEITELTNREIIPAEEVASDETASDETIRNDVINE